MPSLELDHFVIVAADVEATLRFYRDVLGAEIREEDAWRDGDLAFPVIHFGPWKLNVHSADGNIELVAQHPTAGSIDAALVWPGPLEEATEHLEEHGVEVIYGPVKQPGARGTGASIYFRDPDQNLLEFISYDAESVAGAPDDPMLRPVPADAG
jgi:catechol 2,3-dioxygenase-like lactoylglutathione lyase family enzyme